MKKTIYFKVQVDCNHTRRGCDEVIEKRDNFISENKDVIGKVDSEDLTASQIGNNQTICILRFTYYEK